MASKTPETVTAAQRAAALGISPGSTKKAEIPVATTKAQKDKAYTEQARRALGLPELSLPKETNSATMQALRDPLGDPDDSVSYLSIDDIETYSHNPRSTTNPKYAEIKASMKAGGMTSAITVTRRPGAPKYHPYGGGNTRLEIARELYAEGDMRFARMMVVTKKWTGDAKVISAHLAENENRGDISFWEKAQGVDMFRQAIEDEQGRTLSAVDLVKELKASGINYGLRVVQNYAFAIEHFSPVGQWLPATKVNEVLRPALSGVLDVAHRLSLSDIQSTVFNLILEQHAAALRAMVLHNQSADPEDQIPVVLDTEALVDELQSAAAAALKVSVAQLKLMASALESNSRLTADALRSIQVPAGNRAAAHGRGAPGTQGDNNPAKQRQLPILNPVGTTTAQQHSPAPRQPDQPSQPQPEASSPATATLGNAPEVEVIAVSDEVKAARRQLS
jgi:ParB family protein of integrating conjugative element (PFGI_1 class)